MYAVRQLARLAGITRRTLHYYDEIGLLKPTRVGANDYRYYGEEALLRLQQILLYRELEVPLDEIRRILSQPDFDLPAALERPKTELQRRAVRLERLIATVDDTIQYLKGERPMSAQKLFAAFSEEQQAEYQREAMQIYDPEIVKASSQRWKSYTPAEKQRILDEGNAVYQAFLEAMPQGAASAAAQACVARWRRHMDAE